MKKVKKYNEYLFVREQIKIEFDKLSEEAENIVGFYSHPELITCHPVYKKIIDIGEPAIPFILEKLKSENGYMWTYFLKTLTSENPVDESHKLDMDIIRKDWKNWGKENGYIE